MDPITRYHNTHLTQKLKNNNFICITSIIRLGYTWEKVPIRSSAGERVENKDTPLKIECWQEGFLAPEQSTESLPVIPGFCVHHIYVAHNENMTKDPLFPSSRFKVQVICLEHNRRVNVD